MSAAFAYSAKPFPEHLFDPTGFVSCSFRFAFDGSQKDRTLFIETHPTFVALALESGLPRKIDTCKYSPIESYAIRDASQDGYDIRRDDPAHLRAIEEICNEYDTLVQKKNA